MRSDFKPMPPPLLIPRDDTLFYSLRVLGGSACYLSSSLGFVELIWFAKKKRGRLGEAWHVCIRIFETTQVKQKQTDMRKLAFLLVSPRDFSQKKPSPPSIYGRQKNMRCGRIQKLFPFLQHEFSQTRPSLYVFWMIYIPWTWCQKGKRGSFYGSRVIAAKDLNILHSRRSREKRNK